MTDARLAVANRDARKLFLGLQGLGDDPRSRVAHDDVYATIERLGFVQLDSIQAVERAHHHILFARHRTYRQKHLTRLHERDKRLFEHWTHDAALIPIAFYPHWTHRCDDARKKIETSAFWRELLGDRKMLAEVRRHIETNGATLARDFAHLGKRTGAWWGWAPSKAALEYLWYAGEVAIVARDGFEKVYDLVERVIPAEHRKHKPTRRETVDWACENALARLGIATSGEIAAFWKLATPDEAKAWVARNARKLVPVSVEPIDGSRPRDAVARPDIEILLDDIEPPPDLLRALNPFDPVLRDRNRAERLFGFDYRIEVFVPAAKRKYGYYVLPLLEGDRFIGRADLKASRKTGTLTVQGLWLEPRVKLGQGRRARLESEFARLGRFCGARDVDWPAHALQS